MKRLGSFYAFDQAARAEVNPSTLFSTVARDLVDQDALRKRKLLAVIKDDTNVRKTRNVAEQFEAFILAPARAISDAIIGDIVIVIDAFDESADVSGRKELLKILTNRAGDLPEGVKIIVTSRSEPDLWEALHPKHGTPQVDIFILDDVSEESTSSDIKLFVHHELGGIEDLEIHTPKINLLADKAKTSFQWASTVCRYITNSDDGEGADPADRLKWVLAGEGGIDKLDTLYTFILDRSFRNAREETLLRLITHLGLIMYSVEPLSLRTLTTLGATDAEPTDADLNAYTRIARALGSLLHGVHELDTPIKPLHASFHDFICDSLRSGKYFVQRTGAVQLLTLRCLEVMMSRSNGLKFNICEFPSSFIRNQDIPDFNEQVSKRISPTLVYASKNWASHSDSLEEWSALEILEERVLGFLRSRFTQWLEVMSAMQAPPFAPLVKFKQLVEMRMVSNEASGC